MLEFFGNLDGFIPTVELLVHGHSLFDLIMLNKDSFSLMELFLKHGKLSLNTEVVSTLSSDKLVQFSEVVSTCHISEGSVAALSNV